MAKFFKRELIAAIVERRDAAQAAHARGIEEAQRNYAGTLRTWINTQIEQQEELIKIAQDAIDKLAALTPDSVAALPPMSYGTGRKLDASNPRHGGAYFAVPEMPTASSSFNTSEFDAAIRELELMIGEEVSLPSSNKLLKLAL